MTTSLDSAIRNLANYPINQRFPLIRLEHALQKRQEVRRLLALDPSSKESKSRLVLCDRACYSLYQDALGQGVKPEADQLVRRYR